ncbi:MAG: zinc ribbon domain-containing protein, partial [Flavobacteriales bacterium]|nr:zinc ribbon domain-containing protein [Flavobacteriales bacterium]
MEKINCYKCNNPNNPITAKFCNECGAGMICECGQIIIGGNFCSNCAKPIGDNNSESKISGRNKFVFREDADGRHMEADFSDHAAKDFSETLRDVLVAKHLTAGSLPENTDVTAENEQIEDAEIVGDQDTKTPSKNNNDTSNPKVENYPTLQSVVLKNLPSSEIEWVIVYSFYASDFGSKQYTRSDILKMYEVTNRKTKNTARDLGSRIRRAVQSNCINPLNTNGDFSILDAGIDKAKEIIS